MRFILCGRVTFMLQVIIRYTQPLLNDMFKYLNKRKVCGLLVNHEFI